MITFMNAVMHYGKLDFIASQNLGSLHYLSPEISIPLHDLVPHQLRGMYEYYQATLLAISSSYTFQMKDELYSSTHKS